MAKLTDVLTRGQFRFTVVYICVHQITSNLNSQHHFKIFH